MELEPVHTASRGELVNLQLPRLRATVRLASGRVPLYGARVDAIGISPGDIHELTDIQRLPFSTQGDLQDQYPSGWWRSRVTS
ncbi:MAG TPA: hypothetical protein VMW80_04115 [Candidatus Dormibacteraeota bacterium]|nr:hypothetical protein [Candidatus Dormibacteraeota bacterium]